MPDDIPQFQPINRIPLRARIIDWSKTLGIDVEQVIDAAASLGMTLRNSYLTTVTAEQQTEIMKVLRRKGARTDLPPLS